MFSNLYKLFAGFSIAERQAGKNPFSILFSSCAVTLLSDLYKNILKDITPLENLPQEKKQLYWNEAKKYYESQEQRIKACKAAYVLELITE
ncbi:MAG: hypothetical protein QM791_04250 [Ferruginibacter sp.]